MVRADAEVGSEQSSYTERLRVSDFHFDLPEELIAQHPPAERGASRMLAVARSQAPGTGCPERPGEKKPWLTDAVFRDLPKFLRAGDLLVLNDSRVLPARLFATRAGLSTQSGSPRPSGLIEVLLTEEVEQGSTPVWRALVKPAKKVRVGEMLEFRGADGQVALVAEVVGEGEFGERTLRFAPVEDFYGIVSRIGHMPLPPYIRRDQAREADSEEDRERYQTVYAQRVGSAAAPTAGLHFTPEVLEALKAHGVEIAYVTLHVGLGTFQPVRVSEVKDIRLHAERYTLPEAMAEALNRAMAEGRRVVAVGTTTTRVLEHVAQQAEMEETPVAGAKARNHFAEDVPGLRSRPIADENSAASESPLTWRFRAHSGETSIFIGPGYRFRVVGGLLTNFHLPESTLLMLVSAFAGNGGDADEGRRRVLEAYEHAVRERYRFYSYGDCMLLL